MAGGLTPSPGALWTGEPAELAGWGSPRPALHEGSAAAGCLHNPPPHGSGASWSPLLSSPQAACPSSPRGLRTCTGWRRFTGAPATPSPSPSPAIPTTASRTRRSRRPGARPPSPAEPPLGRFHSTRCLMNPPERVPFGPFCLREWTDPAFPFRGQCLLWGPQAAVLPREGIPCPQLTEARAPGDPLKWRAGCGSTVSHRDPEEGPGGGPFWEPEQEGGQGCWIPGRGERLMCKQP